MSGLWTIILGIVEALRGWLQERAKDAAAKQGASVARADVEHTVTDNVAVAATVRSNAAVAAARDPGGLRNDDGFKRNSKGQFTKPG